MSLVGDWALASTNNSLGEGDNWERCVTQLLSVLHAVGQSLDNNIQSDMIYLDFAKAFDTVDHSAHNS